MQEYIEEITREHIECFGKTIYENLKKIEIISKIIIDCYKNDKKIVLFGNGGSAADAQHIAGELVSKFKIERKSLPAIALTTNTSVISAIGNDYGFDRVFEKQVEGIVQQDDVVLGITTSGNSENVVRGLMKAKEKRAKTIALTGANFGKVDNIADVVLKAGSDNTPIVQEIHIAVSHIICALVERDLFKNI